MLLTVSDAKAQCRIDDDITDEDSLLENYISASESRIAKRLGRKIYATKTESTNADGWTVSLEEAPEIKLAILLLVGHFYRNREATTEAALKQLPLGVESLCEGWIVEFSEYPPEDNS